MITIENRQVYSSTGLHVHRKGSDVYFHRCTMLPNETEADFEEVENVPEVPEIPYEERVNDLIRERYSLSEELAILRQKEAKPEEYEEYYKYAEECKNRAKEGMI